MIQGIFTSNQGIVGERVGDFASAILQINPTGNALFFALSAGMENRPAQDTSFSWYEDVHQPGRQAVVSGGTTTTIVVADGSGYVPYQILMVEASGEYIMITAVSGNSLTVTRGMAGTTNTSVSGTDFVQLIGNAHEEASDRPVAVTQQGVPRTNYTQIFRNTWAVSGTAKAVKFRTGSKVAANKRFCALYHAEDIERSLIWGKKHVGKLNSKPFTMTDGVLEQIKQYGGVNKVANTGAVAGQLSRIDLEDFIRQVFSKNIKGMPNERIAFCGDLVLQVINNMAALDGTIFIKMEERVMGLLITKVVTPFGSLTLMTHPLMNENPIWAKQLYVLHPGAISKRTLRATFEENYDSNGSRIIGRDADEGIITSELGVEVNGASTMGIYSNISKAVKSS